MWFSKNKAIRSLALPSLEHTSLSKGKERDVQFYLEHCLSIDMFVWGIACAGYALLVLTHAQSAIHEIEGGVALTVATLSFGFSFVIDALVQLQPSKEETVRQAG